VRSPDESAFTLGVAVEGEVKERQPDLDDGLPTGVYNRPSCSHPPSFLHHRIIMLTTAQHVDKYLHPIFKEVAPVFLFQDLPIQDKLLTPASPNSGILTSPQAAISSPKLARSLIRIFHAHYGTAPDKSFEDIAAGGITYHNGQKVVSAAGRELRSDKLDPRVRTDTQGVQRSQLRQAPGWRHQVAGHTNPGRGPPWLQARQCRNGL
jgi:hypothetical protein